MAMLNNHRKNNGNGIFPRIQPGSNQHPSEVQNFFMFHQDAGSSSPASSAKTDPGRIHIRWKNDGNTVVSDKQKYGIS